MTAIWRKTGRKAAKSGGDGRAETPPAVPGYLTSELIGAGAASEVWSARCATTGEPVALKRLRAAATATDVARLRAEAGLLASFTHPNVIGLRGVRSDDDGLVLVLERAARSFGDLVGAHGPLDAGRVVGVLAPIADALSHAHERGILHGDISPGNVLLRSDGVPLLADLGTARLVALCGGASTPVVGTGIYGTPGFTDPVLRHGGEFAAASDVYSLAAVAAYAVVGELLSEAADSVQTWANRAHQLGVSPALAAALCAVLVSPPLSRPTAAQFAAALRETCPAVALSPTDVATYTSPAATAAYDATAGSIANAGGATRHVLGADLLCDSPDLSESRGHSRRNWRTWLGLGSVRNWRTARALRRERLTALRHRYGTPSYFAAAETRQRRMGLMRVGVVLVFIIGAGLGAGLAVTGLSHDDAPSQSTAAGRAAKAPVDPTAEYWRGVLEELDTDRAAAFAALDATLLQRVYAPTSSMLRADKAQLEQLSQSGSAARGLRHDFRAVRVFRQTENRAVLQTSEQLREHRIVRRAATAGRGESGDDAAFTVPTSDPRTVRIDVVMVDGQWRIDAVTPL